MHTRCLLCTGGKLKEVWKPATQQLTHMLSLQAALTTGTVPETYFLLSSGQSNFAVQQHLHQQGHWNLLTGKGMELRFPIQWKCGTAITETNSLYLVFKLIQHCQCVTDAKACNSQNSFAGQKYTQVQMTSPLYTQQNNFTSNLSFQYKIYASKQVRQYLHLAFMMPKSNTFCISKDSLLMQSFHSNFSRAQKNK